MNFRLLTILVTGASFVFLACTVDTAAKKKRSAVSPGDDYTVDENPTDESPLQTNVNPDSGAFGAPERPRKDAGASEDAGPVIVDAGVDAGPVTKTYCAGPLVAGDLALVEIMISTRAGANDDGEWVEIKSTRTCWLKLAGVTVESPRGAQMNIATLDGELAPGGTVVVADSLDGLKNHALPGAVRSWAASDTLKNDGDTIAIKSGALVVDSLTYPAFSNLEPGRTLSFPSDCPPASRSDWQRWSLSFHPWNSTYRGTPNADNNDVACF